MKQNMSGCHNPPLTGCLTERNNSGHTQEPVRADEPVRPNTDSGARSSVKDAIR